MRRIPNANSESRQNGVTANPTPSRRAEYIKQIKLVVDNDVFLPQPIRLLWFIGFQLIWLGSIYICINAESNFIKGIMALTIGIAWGSSGLTAHEIMHDSVISNKFAKWFFSQLGFWPFFILPSAWNIWHNRLHHNHTQVPGLDPDAYPFRSMFLRSRYLKFLFFLTPGSGNILSILYPLISFPIHIFYIQFFRFFSDKRFLAVNRLLYFTELTLVISAWYSLYLLLSGHQLLWLLPITYITANYTVNSYIVLNHNLSMSSVNDPLKDTISVSNLPLLETLHLNFGYHVEHHLFPRVSGIKIKHISRALSELYPDDYILISKWQALKHLYQTPRIYLDNRTLVHPHKGETHKTINRSI